MLSRRWKGPNSSNWETRYNRFFERAAWALDCRKSVNLSEELASLLPSYLPFRDQALKLATDVTQGGDIQHNERRLISYLRAAKWAYQRDQDSFELALVGSVSQDQLFELSQLSWEHDAWPLDIPTDASGSFSYDPRIWEPILTTRQPTITNPRGRFRPKP